MGAEEPGKLSTGISGLDEITFGGFVPHRAYMVRGGPGTGKSTLGLHFLLQSGWQEEKALLITLGEPESQIKEDAEKRGMDLSGVGFLDLSPSSDYFAHSESYDIFTPEDVERDPTTRKIVETIEERRPSRVLIDAMTQFRYLCSSQHQFRKQVLSFLRFLRNQGATVMFTSEGSPDAPDHDLRFMSDGVINLEFGAQGRWLSLSKLRGSDFQSGEHFLRISDFGMEVFPRLNPGEHSKDFVPEPISTGISELDELMHGGVERGTITIITGPSGVGKSTLGLLFMKEAAGRGENSVIYTFEENRETLINRANAINIPVEDMLGQGRLGLNKIDPLQYSPEEFAWLVRSEVEKRDAKIVMLDSLAGYELCLPGENLVGHVHALSKYLANMGVTVLLINEVEFISGSFQVTEKGISYLADNIVFLRYLEMAGSIRKAIGVLKKRMSDFEKTMREVRITSDGVKVGAPLTNLRGVLSAEPTWLEGRGGVDPL